MGSHFKLKTIQKFKNAFFKKLFLQNLFKNQKYSLKGLFFPFLDKDICWKQNCKLFDFIDNILMTFVHQFHLHYFSKEGFMKDYQNFVVKFFYTENFI